MFRRQRFEERGASLGDQNHWPPSESEVRWIKISSKGMMGPSLLPYPSTSGRQRVWGQGWLCGVGPQNLPDPGLALKFQGAARPEGPREQEGRTDVSAS